jgi:hypothetical protein
MDIPRGAQRQNGGKQNMKPATIVVAGLVAALATVIPTATADDYETCQSVSPVGNGSVCAGVYNIVGPDCSSIDGEPIIGDKEDCEARQPTGDTSVRVYSSSK